MEGRVIERLEGKAPKKLLLNLNLRKKEVEKEIGKTMEGETGIMEGVGERGKKEKR